MRTVVLTLLAVMLTIAGCASDVQPWVRVTHDPNGTITYERHGATSLGGVKLIVDGNDIKTIEVDSVDVNDLTTIEQIQQNTEVVSLLKEILPQVIMNGSN